MPATLRYRIFSSVFIFKKKYRLKYAEMQFCLLCRIVVELALSNYGKNRG